MERLLLKKVRKSEEEEDIISNLPDELINHILSYVDSDVAVKTSVLSKRWIKLWTTLPCINFVPPIYQAYAHGDFVTNFLNNRNQQHVISRITMDCRLSQKATRICLDHALSHNVENLCFWNGDFDTASPRLESACLQTLHLSKCINIRPIVFWTLPSLTTLYLDGVEFGDLISGFNNLKELTVLGTFGSFHDPKFFIINCPNLRSLTMSLYSSCCAFVVSAPNLSYLELRSRYVPGFFVADRFPCIKEVYIHIQVEKRDYNNQNLRNLMVKNFIAMWNAVRETLFLKLSSETIQVLQRIPDLYIGLSAFSILQPQVCFLTRAM